MASLVLHDYEYGEKKLSFIPEFERDEFIHVTMYEYNNPGEPFKTTEHGSTFNYEDMVFLKDFLIDAIDFYDQKRKRKEKRKSVVSEKAQ